MTKQATPKGVLYRVYRPSTFAEVRGQEAVVKALQGAIKNKKIAHTYLFSGGRGTGKTSMARIFAHALEVSDKDIYEIDAASHTGVDHIRELREGVAVIPFESPYKVYIIDEAHMLSKSAWNALLKTLEEPPSHVIFIMATTEKDKVPDTIQSRSELYSFKPPTREILNEMIHDVAKKEGFSFEKSAAELIALLADGSFRDALSILQKVLAVSKDKKVDLEEVEAVTDAPKSELVRNFAAAIAERKIPDALAIIKKCEAQDVDARVFTKLVIARFRAVLLLRYAPDLQKEIAATLSDIDMEGVKDAVKHKGIDSNVLKSILTAFSTMTYAAFPYVPLELAVMDLSPKE